MSFIYTTVTFPTDNQTPFVLQSLLQATLLQPSTYTSLKKVRSALDSVNSLWHARLIEWNISWG